MQQVVLIHGGDSFLTYKEYVRFLRSIKITRASLRPQRGWKANLADDLGRGWEVLQPTMPNKMNARYAEWKIWFEKYRPFIRSQAIFVGHSMGGIFLAKYLSEHRWPKKIKAVLFVAPPHNRTEGVGDFRLRRPLAKIANQVPTIIVFHSVDDPIVPYREMSAYVKAIPNIETYSFKNRGHFTQPHFPELVRVLKTIRG